jgi:putative CocE/NonD family hydrolase
MLCRTPYSVDPYGPDAYRETIGPSVFCAREGFIFVYQDVRGRYLSEGDFEDVRPHNAIKRGKNDVDESSDTYDTVEWLIKNVPNNNGRVGMWGISYPGFYTAVGVIDSHPAIKAASPQAPIADWFIGDDFHHNGAFFLPHAFNFYASFGRPRPRPTTEDAPRFSHPTPDGFKFFLELGVLGNANLKYFKNEIAFWNRLMEHPNYDEFWKARATPPHLKNIKAAVMTVGGWFDAEDLYGALETYRAIEKQNSGAANSLVMGPWYHGGWARSDGDSFGAVQFDSKTSLFYREKIELAFFNHHLKSGNDPRLPEAYMFETGSNVWKTYDQWPPRDAAPRSIYLVKDGKLSFQPEPAEGYDEYVSDPHKPVPYINEIATGMVARYMIADQRFVASRPDVLVYQTEPLSEYMKVAGPVEASLFISTSGTD